MFKYTKNELSERAKEMNFVRDTLEKVVIVNKGRNFFFVEFSEWTISTGALI